MHTVFVGLGFGDEGKGAAVDWACRQGSPKVAVIRYNGGAQAAHNVITPDGRHHTFAQFGSGTLHGVPTHLSEYMLVNPFNMYEEAQALAALTGRDSFEITTISRDALLVTPYHRAANRLREDARGTSRHGSTGQGIGETRAYSLQYPVMAPVIGTMLTPYVMERLLEALRDYYTAQFGDLGVEESPRELARQYFEMTQFMNIVPSEYIDTLLDQGDCIFEGAQGVLLDENYGFHPHTTWTDTTANNARKLLGDREYRVIGLTRSYHTRHGAGPFPTQDYETETLDLPEPHNGTGVYQGSWRVGALDLSLLQYAVACNGGVDDIMVSHMDFVNQGIVATYGYTDWTSYGRTPFVLEKLRVPDNRDEQEYITSFFTNAFIEPSQYDIMQNQEDVAQAIEFATGIRPSMFAWGPTALDRRERMAIV